MNTYINQQIDVNAFYFAGTDLRTYPRQIEFDGRRITFRSGLRYLVQKGSQVIRYFDMDTEEQGSVYRLRQIGSNWTLIGVKGGC